MSVRKLATTIGVIAAAIGSVYTGVSWVDDRYAHAGAVQTGFDRQEQLILEGRLSDLDGRIFQLSSKKSPSPEEVRYLLDLKAQQEKIRQRLEDLRKKAK